MTAFFMSKTTELAIPEECVDLLRLQDEQVRAQLLETKLGSLGGISKLSVYVVHCKHGPFLVRPTSQSFAGTLFILANPVN